MLKFNGICHGGVWMERKSFVFLIQLFALLKVGKNYDYDYRNDIDQFEP